MPARKTAALTDAERARRMRDLARETGADNDPATLDHAVKKIVARRPEPAKAIIDKK